MPNVKCVRCTNENPAMARAPYPDALGQRIHESVCQRCWSEWLGMQIKVINEYRLSMGDPQAQKVLVEQMKLFLNLA